MATAIKKCKCVSEYQDKVYGKNMRVHNSCYKDRKITWRCTVCEDKKGES